MKVKAQKIIDLVNSINNYSAAVGKKQKPDGKLFAGLKKNGKILQSITSIINDKIEDLRIDQCSVDDKDNVIRNADGGYVFKKEALKTLKKQIAEYTEKTEVDMPEIYKIDPKLIADDDEREAFELLIDGAKEGKEIKLKE